VGGGVSYSSGAIVMVTATPNPGYTFTGWSGDCPRESWNSSGAGTCLVAMGPNCWQPAKVGHFRKGEIRGKWRCSGTPGAGGCSVCG
jgi:hypothetical protein